MVENNIGFQLFSVELAGLQILLVLFELLNLNLVGVVGEIRRSQFGGIDREVLLDLALHLIGKVRNLTEALPLRLAVLPGQPEEVLQEGVLCDLIPVVPGGWGFLEHALDELSQLNVHGARVLDLVVEDLRQKLVVGVGMERRYAGVQLVDDDAKGPDVDLVVVGLLRDDLRRDVQWRPLERVQANRCSRHFPGETEVAQLNDAVPDEDILGFQVSMHDAVVVEVEQRRHDLPDVVLDLFEFELALLLQNGGEVLAGKFSNQNYLVLIFNMVAQLDDVVVLELLQDFYLLAEALHVLAVFALSGNELEGDHFIGGSVDGTVHLPEGALAHQILDLVLAHFLDFHI